MRDSRQQPAAAQAGGDAVPWAFARRSSRAYRAAGPIGREEINDMNSHEELTVEHASRMTAIAVTADLEYWARTASVDGRVGLNDLTRALDVIREASTLEVDR
jgi:hypothetical protein